MRPIRARPGEGYASPAHARRRIFFGSNRIGSIAVADLDAAGTPVPAPASPFRAERSGVSVIRVAPAGDAIYVGYHADSLVSRYAVAADGSLSLTQSFSTGGRRHVETMLLRDGVLYVGFGESSDIAGYRIAAQGALTTEIAAVPTNVRPDYLVVLGDRLYCSLADDGSVDAFDITATGPALADPPRYEPPGRQIDVIRLPWSIVR